MLSVLICLSRVRSKTAPEILQGNNYTVVRVNMTSNLYGASGGLNPMHQAGGPMGGRHNVQTKTVLLRT